MIFWNDGHKDSTRVKNVEFTWPKMKEITQYLKDNGINCDCELYDFSSEKVITDSVHIPYPVGEFKKSEKLNKIINKNLDYDFIMMNDCDMFFLKEDYPKVLEILQTIEYGYLHTFDAAKLGDVDYNILKDENFNLHTLDYSFAYSGSKSKGPLADGAKGGLGGIYICDIKLITENGGFNENYIGWGGEDGEMMDKIYYSKNKKEIIPHRDFVPFHLSHHQSWNNVNYFNSIKQD